MTRKPILTTIILVALITVIGVWALISPKPTLIKELKHNEIQRT